MTAAIDRLTSHDVPALIDISIECGLCLWSADAYRCEIARDDSIMLKLAGARGEVLGFAVGRIFQVSSHKYSVELTNIGVRKAFREQGFGSLLLKSFLERSSEVGASFVILEVRVSNYAAIGFYRKFGFQDAGRRRGFYSDPVEDALTMRLELAEVEPVHGLTIHT